MKYSCSLTSEELAMRHAIAILLVTTLLPAGADIGRAETLENENVVASFDDNGLVSLYDKQLEKTLDFWGDYWSLVIEHHLVDSRYVPARKQVREAGGLRCFFREGEFDVEVLYQRDRGGSGVHLAGA
jgi:hypothetical protein